MVEAPPRSAFAQFWPPSEESAPFLIAFLVIQLTLLAFIFGRRKEESVHLKAAKDEKRKRYAESMALIVESEASKDKDFKATDKEPVRTTKLPEATRVFSVLYDEIDGKATSRYGIGMGDSEKEIETGKKNQEGCFTLLDRAVRAEMSRVQLLSEESIKPIEDLVPAWLEEHNTTAKEISDHADGAQLDAALALVESIRKKLGKSVLSADVTKLESECRALKKRMIQPAGAARQSVKEIGFAILPLWISGVFFMTVFSMFWAEFDRKLLRSNTITEAIRPVGCGLTVFVQQSLHSHMCSHRKIRSLCSL